MDLKENTLLKEMKERWILPTRPCLSHVVRVNLLSSIKIPNLIFYFIFQSGFTVLISEHRPH